jgi:hypothetical protein
MQCMSLFLLIGWFDSKSVAATGDVDHFRTLQKAIEGGGGARDIADQFATIFKRSVAIHYRAANSLLNVGAGCLMPLVGF